MSGQGGSVRTDFLAEDGSVQKTRTDSIGAFALLELSNEAPFGATSATVTNLGSGSRIVAEGLVFDEATGDSTNLVDWNKRNGTAASEPQIILHAATGSANGKKVRTDLWMTNIGSGQASGTLAFYGGPGRRRVVGRSTTPPSGVRSIESLDASKTISIDAGRTRLMRDVLASEFSTATGSGYLVYTPTSGTVAISARTYSHAASASADAAGSSGTGIPVLAASTGLKTGEQRQFASLEDASPSSVATAEPGTYRTGFGLIESSGKSATVKVTLRYQAPVTGGLASVALSASKEYVLGARQAVLAGEIGQALFGNGRLALGDLHDLVLEIAVTGGEGRVIPYVLATENGSRDTLLRIE